MAKCPKCNSRKGKRYCPALDRGICPQCCADHRLQTIRCPADCIHLQGETYQLQRRRERASSSGRAFVRHIKELFLTPQGLEFAFLTHADVYWWMQENDRLSNELAAASCDDARGRLSSVYVPSPTSLPLGEFLYRLQVRGERHRQLLDREFTEKHRLEALKVLSRHIRSLGRPEGHEYAEELEGYFGHLDFEADLDYSPREELEDEKKPQAGQPERSAGGIILPGPSGGARG